MKTNHWYMPATMPTLSPSARQELFAVKVLEDIKGSFFIKDRFRAIVIYAWKACGIRVGPKADDFSWVETICFYRSDDNYRSYQMNGLIEVTDPKQVHKLEKQLVVLDEKDKADAIKQAKWEAEEQKKTVAGFNKFIG
jgi:hypothetical protein